MLVGLVVPALAVLELDALAVVRACCASLAYVCVGHVFIVLELTELWAVLELLVRILFALELMALELIALARALATTCACTRCV